MATTIDALVISLGIDSTQFTEGQRAAIAAFERTQEAAVQGGKNIEAQGKKTAEYFSGLKREVLTLLAVVAGGKGFVDMVNHITTMDASTARLARSTGTVAANLAKWQIAAREVGGTREDANSAVRGVARSLAESQFTQNWDPGLVAVFSRLGLDRSEWGDPDKVLTALGKLGQSPEMQAHPERFAPMALRVPGMTEGLMNLFLDPRYKQLMANAVKMTPDGGGLGPESQRFQESMALFTTAVDNFSRSVLDWIGVPIMDSLRKLIGAINDPSGEDAADLHEAAAKKSFGGVARAFANWVDYGAGGYDPPRRIDPRFPDGPAARRQKPPPGAPLRSLRDEARDTPGGYWSSHGNDFGPGTAITGIDVGAPAAAAASSGTNVDRSSRSTSKTDINIGTVNLPGVKDARGFADELDSIGGNQSYGAAVTRGPN
jgi:hypothetical protein